jgi:hypothetical protein
MYHDGSQSFIIESSCLVLKYMLLLCKQASEREDTYETTIAQLKASLKNVCQKLIFFISNSVALEVVSCGNCVILSKGCFSLHHELETHLIGK